MQGGRIRIGAALLALLATGCASRNFIVYKEGKSFYLASDGPDRTRILCDSGDLARIVEDSRLPAPLKAELKERICVARKGKKDIMDTLNGMTKEQHADLKTAFRENGYEINRVAEG